MKHLKSIYEYSTNQLIDQFYTAIDNQDLNSLKKINLDQFSDNTIETGIKRAAAKGKDSNSSIVDFLLSIQADNAIGPEAVPDMSPRSNIYDNQAEDVIINLLNNQKHDILKKYLDNIKFQNLVDGVRSVMLKHPNKLQQLTKIDPYIDKLIQIDLKYKIL